LNELPDLDPLKPVATGTTDQFEISRRTQEVHLGFRFTGFVEIPKDGTYTFFTVSDDGSKLWIGKSEVVTNDGCHPAVEQSGDILLKKGKHAITVAFFQNEGASARCPMGPGPPQKIPRGPLRAAST
jgi:hypothetical protein